MRTNVVAKVNFFLTIGKDMVHCALLMPLDVQKLCQVSVYASVFNGSRFFVEGHVRMRHGAIRIRAIGCTIPGLALAAFH